MKYLSAWPLGGLQLLGGGLEPAFRVLFSAIFHEFRSGISIRVAICGREWNQNCSFFVVKSLTKFSCVLAIVCLFTSNRLAWRPIRSSTPASVSFMNSVRCRRARFVNCWSFTGRHPALNFRATRLIQTPPLRSSELLAATSG
jgi:hypothetical protein